MRGLDSIAEMRRQGAKPDHVSLGLPGIGLSCGALMAGQVLVESRDRPELVDLRPLVGLRVVVMSLAETYASAEAWMRAVCRANARDVGLAVLTKENGVDGPVWVRLNGEQLA